MRAAVLPASPGCVNTGNYAAPERFRIYTTGRSGQESGGETVGQRLRLELASLFFVMTLVAIGAMAGAVACP